MVHAHEVEHVEIDHVGREENEQANDDVIETFHAVVDVHHREAQTLQQVADQLSAENQLMSMLANILQRHRHMIYKEPSVHSKHTNYQHINTLLNSQLQYIEDSYAFFDFFMMSITYGFDWRFALIPYQVQNTEPFINLKDIRQRRWQYLKHFKNRFDDKRHPNLASDEAVRGLVCLAILLVSLPIDVDIDDYDRSVEI